MKHKSEGIRRIIIICSILCVIGYFYIVYTENYGFSYGVEPLQAVAIVIGAVITYFTPTAIAKLIYWILDGFSQDKEQQ